ncbi:putative nucleotide exchange factor Fes1 [Lyophyllum shimeji]|uniref:Nucleotide exchange factor Fes1 n=1 Tax=Lyophyllum shimeji TaxID=47721 RepID=A0A9P3Q0I4_LYOSH|nr:putative nucleotide exchange factor Fes1 [Lyophyllum shimeji]
MQSLLRWSIENSAPAAGAQGEPTPPATKDLDPEIINMILGRPDAEQMKEDMAVASDPAKDDEVRVEALDHLEMLIEHIDNANDLVKLGLWEPLHGLLIDSASTPEIKRHALWVIGTALQNNPSAQDAYLKLHPLPTLMTFLAPSTDSTLQTRSKAIYTLSGLLKHNAPAVHLLDSPEVDGWTRLRDALQDPEITVRRKAIFLLNTLLLPSTPMPPSSSSALADNLHTPDSQQQPVHDNSHAAYIHDPSRADTSPPTRRALREKGVLAAVVSALTTPVPSGEDGDVVEVDATFEETCVRLLHTYTVLCNEPLPPQEKEALRRWVEEEEKKEGGLEEIRKEHLAERWGLDQAELAQLQEKLQA